MNWYKRIAFRYRYNVLLFIGKLLRATEYTVSHSLRIFKCILYYNFSPIKNITFRYITQIYIIHSVSNSNPYRIVAMIVQHLYTMVKYWITFFKNLFSEYFNFHG